MTGISNHNIQRYCEEDGGVFQSITLERNNIKILAVVSFLFLVASVIFLSFSVNSFYPLIFMSVLSIISFLIFAIACYKILTLPPIQKPKKVSEIFLNSSTWDQCTESQKIALKQAFFLLTKYKNCMPNAPLLKDLHDNQIRNEYTHKFLNLFWLILIKKAKLRQMKLDSNKNSIQKKKDFIKAFDDLMCVAAVLRILFEEERTSLKDQPNKKPAKRKNTINNLTSSCNLTLLRLFLYSLDNNLTSGGSPQPAPTPKESQDRYSYSFLFSPIKRHQITTFYTKIKNNIRKNNPTEDFWFHLVKDTYDTSLILPALETFLEKSSSSSKTSANNSKKGTDTDDDPSSKTGANNSKKSDDDDPSSIEKNTQASTLPEASGILEFLQLSFCDFFDL